MVCPAWGTPIIAAEAACMVTLPQVLFKNCGSGFSRDGSHSAERIFSISTGSSGNSPDAVNRKKAFNLRDRVHARTLYFPDNFSSRPIVRPACRPASTIKTIIHTTS